MFNPRYLVFSFGNPAPNNDSLHSAGHYALTGLAKLLNQDLFQPVKMKHLPQTLASEGPKYTLMKSPLVMNMSGSCVAHAWRHIVGQTDEKTMGLVVLHDDLESKMGVIKLTPWKSSAKGHKGVKGAQVLLAQERYPESPMARISIGIGRPPGREKAVVKEYVLRKISPQQRLVFEDKSPPRILEQLERMERHWAAEIEAKKKKVGLNWGNREDMQ